MVFAVFHECFLPGISEIICLKIDVRLILQGHKIIHWKYMSIGKFKLLMSCKTGIVILLYMNNYEQRYYKNLFTF